MARKTLKDHLADDLTCYGRTEDKQVREFIAWMLRESEKIAHVTEVRHANPRFRHFEACSASPVSFCPGGKAAEEDAQLITV